MTKSTFLGTALLVAIAALPLHRAEAVTHLKRGMTAPTISLPDLSGGIIATADLRGRSVVLIFGELYHRKTLDACVAVQQMLSTEPLADEPIVALLVVTEDADPRQLRARADEASIEMAVLRDTSRRTFGEYRVAVMPSVVVLDDAGNVVHAVAGLTRRFGDTVSDALRVATGRLSVEQFDKTMRANATVAGSEEHVRAERVSNLARQLVQRGLDELAETKFREALELEPSFAPARLGLAKLLRRRGRLAAAEAEFQRVLAEDPRSTQASLGLAYLQILRGGDELTDAERLCHDVLVRNASDPRAHYLLGLIHEHFNDTEQAIASFRHAAELLLSRTSSGGLLDVQEPVP